MGPMLGSPPSRAQGNQVPRPARRTASAGTRPSPSPSARAVLLSVLTAALVATSACNLPEGDPSTPEGVHYATLRARSQGDGDRLWELLAPADRALFDRWVAADREGARLVTTSYPADQRAQALDAFPTRAFGSGHDLFVSLVGASGPLGLGARAGARVRAVKTQGDTATVATWGGDTLRYVRSADGTWHCTLFPDERATIAARAAAAEANLAAAKAQVRRLLGQ